MMSWVLQLLQVAGHLWSSKEEEWTEEDLELVLRASLSMIEAEALSERPLLALVKGPLSLASKKRKKGYFNK